MKLFRKDQKTTLNKFLSFRRFSIWSLRDGHLDGASIDGFNAQK
jgi:hypothetical protein